MDGHLVFGNNHLTHEFGHFMGLVHPFPELIIKLMELAGKGNSKNLPLTPANLPEMEGVTEQDVELRKQQALDYIATWPFSLEQDNCGRPDAGIPDDYSIMDTPIDMGFGLPLVHGQLACQDSFNYTFTRYHWTDLQEIKDSNGKVIWWEPKPGAAPKINENVSLNDIVRRNTMSYWQCNPEGLRFSPDQVKRMNFVLEHLRPNLVSRVVQVNRFVHCWMVRLPLLMKRFIPPWEPVVRALLFPLEIILRVLLPRSWQALVVVNRVVRGYQSWDPDNLSKYLVHLKRSGVLREPQSATTEVLNRSLAERSNIS
ncbi:MAG: hypothetical protein JSV84_11900 [Gemmatimonadota bacterium]|nr:MAG: hypothetical protein JSV84_11900 [Gemmatimonadota bacterium]